MTAESSARPLRIGIVTDSMRERIVNGEVRIANGGVGVYIYQLIRHLLIVDSVNEYFLIRFDRGFLDVYQHPQHTASSCPPGRSTERWPCWVVRIRVLSANSIYILIHFPNLFGGSSLSPSIRQVATLHDLTPLFPSMHPALRLGQSHFDAPDAEADQSHNRAVARYGRDLVETGLASYDRIVCIPHDSIGSFDRRKRLQSSPGAISLLGRSF